MNKDFSSCASNKVFKICSFELNKDIDSIDESNCMAVVVQRLECTVVGVKRNVFVFEDGKFRETRVRLSPSACAGNSGFLTRNLPIGGQLRCFVGKNLEKVIK